MTTLGEARSRLRLWLEDPTPGGLWDDDELDEALRQALETYAVSSPLEVTAALSAAAGDQTLSLPAGAGQVARVTDPHGWVIPRRAAPQRDTGAEELAWERWGDALAFSRPLLGGDYSVRYYGARLLPALDDDPLPIPDADVTLLLAGATLWAIEERMRQEWKRGPLPARYESRRDAACQDYRDLLGSFRRRIRTGTLESPS